MLFAWRTIESQVSNHLARARAPPVACCRPLLAATPCCFFQQLPSLRLLYRATFPHLMKKSICPEGSPQPASRNLVHDHLFPDCAADAVLALLHSPAVTTNRAQIDRVRRASLFRHDGRQIVKLETLFLIAHVLDPPGDEPNHFKVLVTVNLHVLANHEVFCFGGLTRDLGHAPVQLTPASSTLEPPISALELRAQKLLSKSRHSRQHPFPSAAGLRHSSNPAWHATRLSPPRADPSSRTIMSRESASSHSLAAPILNIFIRHMVKTRFTRQGKDSESGRKKKKRRQGSQQQNSSTGSISDTSCNSQLLLPFHRLQKSVSFFFPLQNGVLAPVHLFFQVFACISARRLPFQQCVLRQSLPVLGLLLCLKVCLTARSCCHLLESLAFSAKDMTLMPASSGPSKKCSNSLTSTWILSLLSLYFSIVSRTTIDSSQTVGSFWWAASHTFCYGFTGQNFVVWVCS